MNEIREGEEILVEEISIPEIVGKRIFPIIDRYKKILEEDVETLKTYFQRELADVPEEDLGTNKENLNTLKTLLKEYVNNPEKFEVAFSLKDKYTERYWLKIKRSSESKRLPIEPEKAITELSLELVLEIPYEEREERIASLALTRSPEEALGRIKKEAPREIRLTISTDRVYWDPKEKKVMVTRQSGVRIISSSQEGLMSEGVIYSGNTPHHTEPFTEKTLSHEECVALREYVLGVFNQK